MKRWRCSPSSSAPLNAASAALSLPQRAWAECSDVVAELRKRAEEPRPQEGTAAAANREANIQRLIELTDHDYNEMLEVRVARHIP